MDSLNRVRWKRICIRIVLYGAAAFFLAAGLLLLKEQITEKSYYVPKEEQNVQPGIPLQMELEELTPTEEIRVGFHNPVYVEDDKVFVYLTKYYYS